MAPPQNPAPDSAAGQVAAFQQIVSAHGSPERSILAVLVDQQLGGPVDVGVGGSFHSHDLPAYHPGTSGTQGAGRLEELSCINNRL
jgi:hypothetical protein